MTEIFWNQIFNLSRGGRENFSTHYTMKSLPTAVFRGFPPLAMAVMDGISLRTGKGAIKLDSDGVEQSWRVVESDSQPFLRLHCHAGVISSLTFSPDGKWLASGSWDQTICLWNMVSPPFYERHKLSHATVTLNQNITRD